VELFPTLEDISFGGKLCTVSVAGLEVLLRLPDLKEVLVYRKEYATKLKELKPGLRVQH
jgi:hypothetical protein